MKILLVEDDKYIAKSLTTALVAQHYVVDVATDGQAGWELAAVFAYDIILLDVMLPKLDGISLCQRLRREGHQMPILLLTAQSDTAQKVVGLDAGADDYLIKPFELQELFARVRVLLRRGNASLPPVLESENLRLNPSTCEVTYAGKPLKLTAKEYRLLELFLRNSHRVFSRNAIIEHLWSFEELPNEGTVTAHMMGLRQKLKTAGAPADFIETVYGLGYRLKLPVTESFKEGNVIPRREPGNEEKKEGVQEKIQAAMTQVWEQFKDQISDRVAVLDQTAKALLENTLDEPLRQQARAEAHKLAGALGMFGFTEGTRLAREAQEILQAETILDRLQALRFWELILALRREIGEAAVQKASQPVANHRDSLVLIIDDDADLGERIKMEASKWGVRVEVATDLSTARTRIASLPPDAVLLDVSFPGAEGLTMLAELANRTTPIPVLVLTAQDSFTTRVEVARLGARGFLHKPVPPERVLEAVTQMLSQLHHLGGKIMVVDDDVTLLAALKTLLEPWGVSLITLDSPLRFWDAIAESAPDLLILDVEMPDISGIELCRVVRNDPRWSDLPVLFLTAHTDADTVRQVFLAGADDYVSKPIIEPELIARVISRIERSRLQKIYLSSR